MIATSGPLSLCQSPPRPDGKGVRMRVTGEWALVDCQACLALRPMSLPLACSKHPKAKSLIAQAAISAESITPSPPPSCDPQRVTSRWKAARIHR